MSEHWLCDGVLEYADGDVGDKNHQMVVWGRLLAEFADAVRPYMPELAYVCQGWVDQDSGDPTALRCAINDIADSMQRRGLLTAKQADQSHAWLRRKLRWDAVKFNCLTASTDDSDIRLWAMQTLGWVRIVPGLCELWKVTGPLLRQLAEALWELHEDDADGMLFTIEERRPDGQAYMFVPYPVICRARPPLLREYAKLACQPIGPINILEPGQAR